MTARQKSNGHSKRQRGRSEPIRGTFKRNRKKTPKLKFMFSDVKLKHEEKPNILKEAIDRLVRAFPDKGTVLEFDGEKYLNQRWLLNMGVQICECCGYPSPIENKKCPLCMEESFIICQ